MKALLNLVWCALFIGNAGAFVWVQGLPADDSISRGVLTSPVPAGPVGEEALRLQVKVGQSYMGMCDRYRRAAVLIESVVVANELAILVLAVWLTALRSGARQGEPVAAK